MQYFSIKKEEWDKAIENLLSSHTVFATVNYETFQDYELIKSSDIRSIAYNHPKPATPLKSFFLPFRENVTSAAAVKPRIIIGTPNCDIEGIRLLDEIYKDPEYNDIFYNARRENTLLISSDCFGRNENCHCTSYGIMPYATDIADLAVVLLDRSIYLRVITDKGERFVKNIPGAIPGINKSELDRIDRNHASAESLIRSENNDLPDLRTTGIIVSKIIDELWDFYSSDCVSCGACSVICPTCTCFLLLDKPGFEKIRQSDACQYPGFERVAGGEDPLGERYKRFRNRYMCKYVWKPMKFRSTACTGCGRCIDACPGKISKNRIFVGSSK